MGEISEKTCLFCHDKANSPDFNFEEYKAAVLHDLNYYTVKSGDWLSKIAAKYYSDLTKWQKILKANGVIISNPDRIFPGQKIIIPVIPLEKH